MDIEDQIVLNAADKIEYNTIGEFQTSGSNMPVYYIVIMTGNAYTLQEQYTFHVFDPPVIIPEGELVCTAKFMKPMRKPFYWYHNTYEAIPVMAKLKQNVIIYIEFIQDIITTK